MPSKKKTPKARTVNGDEKTNTVEKHSKEETNALDEPADVKDEEIKPEPESNASARKDQEADGKAPKKRGKAASTDEPRKASRRSNRSGAKSEPSKQQLLNYMVSPAAAELTRPDDEVEDVQSRGEIKTYSASVLNPFEELLCAVILSRPISHRLGLRTIRTVLNDPYNFNSARSLKDAGDEKRLKSVYDARTQHKDKTAAQMGIIAEAVLDNFTSSSDQDGTELQKLRDACGDDIGEAADQLKSHIKGLGKTGLEIFFRRVQWIWTAAFPNIDGRTADSLRLLGLPQDGSELEGLIEEHWKKLETKHLAGDGEEAKKKRAFVVLLERATGAQLEQKIDAVLNAAAEA